MKTIQLESSTVDVTALLKEAGDEDLLVRTPDGREFFISAVDDFDEEINRTRRNERLMKFLDERARQPATVPMAEVRRRLGLD